MSIEKYFKRSQEKILPSPHGSLSLSVLSRAIAAANKEVGRVLRQQSSASATMISKKRGKYNKYSPEERAMIAKHAVLYGICLPTSDTAGNDFSFSFLHCGRRYNYYACRDQRLF